MAFILKQQHISGRFNSYFRAEVAFFHQIFFFNSNTNFSLWNWIETREKLLFDLIIRPRTGQKNRMTHWNKHLASYFKWCVLKIRPNQSNIFINETFKTNQFPAKIRVRTKQWIEKLKSVERGEFRWKRGFWPLPQKSQKNTFRILFEINKIKINF